MRILARIIVVLSLLTLVGVVAFTSIGFLLLISTIIPHFILKVIAVAIFSLVIWWAFDRSEWFE